ncbi:hypothetical protein [Chelativorans sp. Marseille-P2723]|uniref:hypothetical protein n=1 Tax=Chelativorans sp. Marseille-P2723 TaxID=2709133 RepID=UPI00157027A5|nr:hypothetical protein [Chelativorans sp. Marseille-P2723]
MVDPFHGTWTIDTAESAVWDDNLGKHVPDEVGEEVITLRIEDGVQDYEVLYGDRPKIRIGYTAPYDGVEWVPYAVREIISSSADPAVELDEFKRRIKASGGVRERRFEVGQTYGLVRLIYVDERTHYRVSRNPLDGKAQHIMLRRMAEDGDSYVARVFDVNGIVHRIRKFVRVD